MFKIKVDGLEEAIEYFEAMIAKVDKVAEAMEDGKDVKQVRSSLNLKKGTHRSPLMQQEHAQMIAKGEVTEKDMYEAYWTVEDIATYLTED